MSKTSDAAHIQRKHRWMHHSNGCTYHRNARTGRQAGRQARAGRHAHTQGDRQARTQTNRPTGTQSVRQTDRQTVRQTHTHYGTNEETKKKGRAEKEGEDSWCTCSCRRLCILISRCHGCIRIARAPAVAPGLALAVVATCQAAVLMGPTRAAVAVLRVKVALPG